MRLEGLSVENPKDLRYCASHEWLRVNDDGSCTVGISHHAQEALGELVYVELPDVGASVTKGETCAVVESTKAASDVYSPIDGEVIAVNDVLADAPEAVNESAFDKGWLFQVKPSQPDQIEAMLDATQYESGLDA